MPKIHLTTFIAAPIETVFDLSRSIDLHMVTAASTREEVIAGVSTGLVKTGDMVTWQARHLFKTRQFSSAITGMQAPVYFSDEMTAGDFKSFRHEHHFKTVQNGTIMIDQVEFEVPYGAFGRFVNKWFLRSYLEKFIKKRNAVIKEYAETAKWKTILP